jgi:hypothetical protein
MYRLQIIVPHDLVCETVHANGHVGVHVDTIDPPGFNYSVQTWEVPENSTGSYYVTYQLKKPLPKVVRIP